MAFARLFSVVHGLGLWRRTPGAVRRVLALWCGLWCCAAAHGAPLYVCPGNLFTNEIDPTRAQVQGCRAVSGEGLSQAALADPPARSAAVAVAHPVSPTGTPVKPRLRAAASPVSVSRARSPSRHGRAAAGVVASGQQVDPSLQRERDRDALAILQAELARTQSAQQALASAAAGAQDHAALQRLRVDEVALRRELERFQR